MGTPPQPRGSGPTCPYDESSVRTAFGESDASLTGWPSRGGLIVLDPAYACDFAWLGLDPLDPQMERASDAASEDAFCQKLLLLGAKWWDNEARYSVVKHIQAMALGQAAAKNRIDGAFILSEQSLPTMREKRLIRVGWPSDPKDKGLWVAEFDTTWSHVDEEENLLEDEELGRLSLVRTMDEKCTLLRDRFQAKYYSSIEEYSGYGFLKAWDENHTGEVGRLLQPEETVALWRNAYYKRH